MKKALVWLKAYWYVPALAIVMIALFLTNRTSTIEAILKLINKSNRQQKEEFDKIDKEAQEKREEEEKLYNEAIEQLEEQLNIDRDELDKKTKDRVKKLVKKNSNEELAKKLSEEFGITLG